MLLGDDALSKPGVGGGSNVGGSEALGDVGETGGHCEFDDGVGRDGAIQFHGLKAK